MIGPTPAGEAVFPERAPAWLRPLVDVAPDLDALPILRHRPPVPAGANRPAAVLVLFGDGPAGPDVLLMERSAQLRDHAGQVAFPGGGLDPGDSGPVGAALREAEEETGLAPSGVAPLATMPQLFVPPSGFVVTPVLGYWERPVAVRAVDPGETAVVARIPVAALTNPTNRLMVSAPSGHRGPAFQVEGLLVWGFTGGLLSALLHAGGWDRPWDTTRVQGVGEAWSTARAARREAAGS